MNSVATTTMMDTMLLRAGIRRGLLVDLALIVAFSWVIALAARISFLIPGTAVPITGQTFAVLLTGALLGSRRGSLSIMTYLAQGAMGLPVFAISGAMGYGGGAARFAGPSGGYLIGFVAAAFLVGFLAERGWDRRFWTTVLAMLGANVVIYVFGLPWLARFFAPGWLSGWQLDFKWLDPTNGVLLSGLYPFIPGDIIKVVLAAVALPTGWRLLSRFRE